MAAPASVDDFLIVLARSKLVEGNRLDGFLRRMNAVPVEPERLAEQMAQAGLLTPFQVRHLLKGRYLRFFIGPYMVLDRIGAGTSGAVYLCEHQRLRRRVAVKVLLNTRAHDPSMVMRFEREARAVAALDHPNIVHAFDVGCLDGLHYLVMEYIDGVSLQHLVKKEGPLSARRAMDFLRQAALGMQHAHEAGLVHRDLKPANLMIDQSGVLKILDLGLALISEDEMDLTRGAVLGSAAYMAPEQAMDSHHVDARADIYALGATFYQCLTGRAPLAESFLTPPPRPSTGDARLFNRLLDLLQRMMSTGPADRPQSAAAVAAELATWPLPQPAEPPAPARKTVLAPKTAHTTVIAPKPSAALTEPDLQQRRDTKIVPAPPTVGSQCAGTKRGDAPRILVVTPQVDTPVGAVRLANLAKAGKAAAGAHAQPVAAARNAVAVAHRPAPALMRPVAAIPRKAPVTQRPASAVPPPLPVVRGIAPVRPIAAAARGGHWFWLLAGAGLTGIVMFAGHLLKIW